MKNTIKIISLICCIFISVLGFNALNSSQALQKPGPPPPPSDPPPSSPNNPPSSAPNFNILTDQDLPGLDIPGSSYWTNSFYDCQMSCSINGNCRAFTFVPAKYYPGHGIGRCWLKYGVPAPVQNRSGMMSGIKQ